MASEGSQPWKHCTTTVGTTALNAGSILEAAPRKIGSPPYILHNRVYNKRRRTVDSQYPAESPCPPCLRLPRFLPMPAQDPTSTSTATPTPLLTLTLPHMYAPR